MNAVPSPRRILVIKLRHHGDVLLATPVARTLKSRFPTSRIDMLVYKETSPILDGNQDLEHVWTLDRGLRGWRRLAHQMRLLMTLRQQRYDWVIHLSDQWQGAVLARLLSKQKAIGFDYPKRKGSRWAQFFTHLAPVAPSNTCHTVEQNLMALLPLGITAHADEARCHLPVTDASLTSVRQKLAVLGVKTPYIAVHPASRWFFKCWEDERFAQVIQTLAEEGWPIVLTSAPDRQERELIKAIMGHTRSEQIVSLAGQLSLPELAAVIHDARLFLGVDSVPMHMAAALGKDTVALFGPSKVNEWRPWMTRFRLVYAADYGPLIDPDAVDTSTNQRYLANIPVEPVLAAAHELLARGNPAA
ncbi:putative lipopolysaccharide heptosyltransferase III [Pseudogulbenkiania subflava]|uniref:Heptosyltransferase-3 n=1 Tax=Pseudogulbenkiania subflava DSM 22618 TaxID=1123014 RepID=A0A1Y6BB27_9NEIS|nr:putative lipopolysaccharide heptosyltransferase III [Pseudogulbenkiania subflava]SMF02267.1 heptosyltransferase-3 [Pseudogulbenkiania subflava DSM 22618]